MAGFTKRSRRCVCCVIPVLPLVVIALYGHRYLLHVFHLKPLAPVGTAPFTTTPTGLDTVGLSSSKTTTTSLRTKYRTRTNLFKAASKSSRDFQLLDKTRVIVDVKQHSDVTKDPVKPDHFKSFRKTNNDFEASDPVLNDVTQHSDVTQDPVKPDLVNTVGKTNNDFEQSDPVLYHTNEKALFKALRNMGLHVTPGMGLRHEAAKTEYERRLMTTLPLVDFRSAPDEKKSKVHILFPKGDYKAGDTIQFRVDLYDGYGRRRTSGGDEIRMRVTSPTGTASLAVQVQDLRNGSYLGTTFLQWKGTSIVKVYLTYPREFLREAARWRLTVHATFWQGMQFSNDNGVTETTACFPSHPVPGYASVCNMTSDNGGLPYYCGLPTDSRLACSHKQSARGLYHVPWVASDSHIKQLLDKIDTKPYRRLIPNQISIPTRARGSPGQRTLPPCRSLPSRRSWDLNSPRGWMDNGKWRPLFCSIRDFQPDDVEQCLTNHTLYLLGDSNMRVWWEAMKNMLTCNRVESGHKHRHRLCEMRGFLSVAPMLFWTAIRNTSSEGIFTDRPISRFGKRSLKACGIE
ncbi:NXPE family member 2-like isoform X2 [Littorina saxatilis]|uniref:NXPE family member 2-like isoform X2 n=1 Tax=Littorina saxatilis TaxID=31220 RepID=UPI0038B46A32